MGRYRRNQRHPQARMRQTKVVIGVEQHQLLPHTVLSLTQRGDPTPDCCHSLPDVQVEPLDKGRMDLVWSKNSNTV